ncbi:hemopexin repeat-containing protein [Aquimarina megaterium]|uniref:hemopexin repeat-containing protein n=1 Tax=Aquimarina megaterium TaxID=1443666 RepID=UPI00094214A4|nr:hemopexin repeat-containing protein [Aquimarina megaterium]
MKTKLFLKLIFLVFLVFITGCEENLPTNPNDTSKQTSTHKKVLLVGIDGLQFERITALNTPNLDKLHISKAYTGGIKGNLSQQATSSGPGWTSILTGVWKDRHGVPNNSSGTYKSKVKSIYRLIKENKNNTSIASIATWSPIHEFLQNDMSLVDYRNEGGSDANSTNLGVHQISNSNHDLVFIHLDNVDIVGHASGFGSAYDNAIIAADQQLGQLMDAITQRLATKNEDWLIMVTTDHGRNSNGGYSHGGATESEKTIFIGMNKPGNQEFKSKISNLPNTDFNGLYGYPAQTSIVPTILRHMEINIETNWQLSSAPLIGVDGPRKLLFVNNNQNELFWISNSENNAEIYKNNQLVTTVPASQGNYLDIATNDGKTTYTIRIEESTASIESRNQNLKIIACLDWNDMLNNRAYFFRNDGQYIRYNKLKDETDLGYPKEINNSSWPGLGAYKELIIAAFKWNNHKGYFFLSDGRYLRYDMNADKVDNGYPALINNNNWPGLEGLGDKVIGAVNWNNDKAYFFLKDGTYIRYSITNDSAEPGYPRPINNSNWPGLGSYATSISSVVDWNSKYVYFFLIDNTYIKYDKQKDAVVSGYPKNIDDTTWPGILN